MICISIIAVSCILQVALAILIATSHSTKSSTSSSSSTYAVSTGTTGSSLSGSDAAASSVSAGTTDNGLNSDTEITTQYGYRVLISDDADLLTDSEEASLLEIMTELSQYGNVGFKTTYFPTSSSTSSYARQYYHSTFGTDSGTVFLIDMKNRNIWIFSDGYMYTVLTTSYADTITDNVYKLASAADYYSCAYKVYSQELQLFKGQRIAQPMKYIGNALIAVALAMLANFFIAKLTTSNGKAQRREIISKLHVNTHITSPQVRHVSTTRRYSPQSSDSSSGGGGGGGGGGSSGGGGGHSF